MDIESKYTFILAPEDLLVSRGLRVLHRPQVVLAEAVRL